MFEGEEFDEEAWAVEREGIASPEEPKGSSHSQHNQRKAESKDDAKSNNEEGDSISRPSTAQSTRTKKGTVDKKAEGNNPILTPGGKKPSRPESSRKYKHSRTRQEKSGKKMKAPQRGITSSSRSKNRSGRKRKDRGNKSDKRDGNQFKLPLKDLTLTQRRSGASQSQSISTRSDRDKSSSSKPVFNIDDIPASARLLRLTTGLRRKIKLKLL